MAANHPPTYAFEVLVRTLQAFLSWTPNLRYFDNRVAILEAWQDGGELAAFNWSDSAIRARVRPFEEARVDADSAAILISSPSIGITRVAELMEPIFSIVGVSSPSINAVVLQVLVPIIDDAVKVQESLTNAVIPTRSSLIRGTDCAILVDGKYAQIDGSFQLQFGVLRSDEMEQRLRGDIVSFHTDQEPSGSRADLSGLPAQAIYGRFSWSLEHDLLVEDLASDLTSWLERTESASVAICHDLAATYGIKIDNPIEGAQ